MKKFLLLIAIMICITSFAQEGMWLLNQIDQLDLKERGLELDIKDIYDPKAPSLNQAIIQLGGGTASFVSPNGLIITNHHVAYGALQRASSVEQDYLTNGFVARNFADEIQAPGIAARLLIEMKDVTKEVLKSAKGIENPAERDEKINEKIREMTTKITEGKDDVDAVVSEMYNGKQYVLFVHKVYSDIRIVYAPPASIGKYGGDIDNWMWPRHTGDFSFLRVYCAPDGSGSDYSEENVPYKPEVWLRTSTSDLDKGDFTFVIGYPGFTTRYRTSNSAAWNLKYNYPFTIDVFGEIIELMDELTADDPEGKLKVAGLRSGLANTMKNYQGKVEGMKKTGYVEEKIQFEKEFTAWVNSDPDRQKKYGHILGDIQKTYKMIEKYKDRDNVYNNFQGLAGTMLNIAAQLYFIAVEMDKPEDERRPGFDEARIQQGMEGLKFSYQNYFEPVDKAMLLLALQMADELPEDQRIEQLDYILDDPSLSLEEWVDKAYETSRLSDLDFVKTIYGKGTDDILALNDPFIEMVIKLDQLNDEIDEVYNVFAADVTNLRKEYIDALYEWKGEGIYPDANGSVRFTAGPVKGYSPEDAVWYYPFTSLSGVISKNTGEEPFDVPEKLIKIYKKGGYEEWIDPDIEDVPVAFLHQIDITGGNSGSPVMNAKGEIIGVVFDGNYEAMISDWQYDYDLQRAISVDIRYVLFVTEIFGDAGFILEEMGVE